MGETMDSCAGCTGNEPTPNPRSHRGEGFGVARSVATLLSCALLGGCYRYADVEFKLTDFQGAAVTGAKVEVSPDTYVALPKSADVVATSDDAGLVTLRAPCSNLKVRVTHGECVYWCRYTLEGGEVPPPPLGIMMISEGKCAEMPVTAVFFPKGYGAE